LGGKSMTMRPWWRYLGIVPYSIHKAVLDENRELKKALAKADDNDNRGPDGRFVSEKKGTFQDNSN
jgi:hypothetical protein